MEPSDLQHVADVIRGAAQEGSPVAPADDERSGAMAAVAVRRWKSFERRAKGKRSGTEDRVEDLAKGLRDAYESDPGLVGPLMEDYRWLAGRIAAVLASE